jgi:riboflavin kinase / FMN adenylyltransferase
MEVTTDPAAFPRLDSGTAVAIGAFDGVHLGHRALIGGLVDAAQRRGLASVALTFDRHPATVVRPESAPDLLTDLDQRLELLATTSLDHTVVLHFDEQRAHEPAEHFVEHVVVGALQAKAVSVGEDFHFGFQRGGNVALLKAMGPQLGFDVLPIALQAVPGIDGPVSSTRIRLLLLDGDVEAAARLLGRPHQVRGVVGRGDRRGRDLGFPTANVHVPAGVVLPADGIYAGRYHHADGDSTPAAINLGRRPTFYADGERLLEAHLLDWGGDLYGEDARIDFVARLRGEERFESADALVDQMRRDVEATRKVLGGGDG